MFKYDRIKEASRQAKDEDHCSSAGRVYELGALLMDGLIRDPADLATALTAGRSVGTSKVAFIYAVDENFAVHVALDGVRGTQDAVKHETLFHNADVRAAGELEIDAGVIVEVDDISGTYETPGSIQTDPLFADAVLTALDRIDAPIEHKERRRLEQWAGRL
jgi:hypothetical protein